MKKNRPLDETASDALYDAILMLDTRDEARAFFNDICTPAEIEALSDRWKVAGLLYRKLPYRQISEETGVSLATVTRVARCLFAKASGYAVVIEKMGAGKNEKK